jgi:integrase
MPKTWTKTIEHVGVKIRLFERAGSIYRDVTLGRTVSASGKPRTEHDIKSLGHSDRKLAERQVKALAENIAEARLTGRTSGELTLAQLRSHYLQHKAPLLSPTRLRTVKSTLTLFDRHLGGGFQIRNLDQHRIDTYAAARRGGRLRTEDYRSRAKPAAGTVRNEIQALSAVCNWAAGYLVTGHPLLTRNPLRGVKVPQEENPRRPRVTPDRYQKIAAVAHEVDRSGQLALMVELAWRTGRRINAILHLTAADVLLEREDVFAALADAGQGQEIAAEWSGGLRWRAEWDKKGYETFSPLPKALRPILSHYMRENGVIGEGWLFAGAEGEPVNKARAAYLLRQAENAANLSRQSRGGWHAFRRGWATLRKSMPVQDVMAAGGWRDPSALQTAYQGADSATMLGVVDLKETA